MSSREFSILEHLAELRRRVFISVLALIVGAGVAFCFFRQIIDLLVRPARDLDAGTGQLVFIEVTELLTTSVKVSLVAGFVLAMPVILYQVIMFVAPGLTGREKRYLLGFLPAVLLAFMAGVAFGYFVLTPPALHFLLTFGADVATPFIRVSNIVNLMIRLLFWMGISFETPLVMYYWPRSDWLTPGCSGGFEDTGWWWPSSWELSSRRRWIRLTKRWWRSRYWCCMSLSLIHI